MNPLDVSRDTNMNTSPQVANNAHPIKFRKFVQASQNKFNDDLDRAQKKEASTTTNKMILVKQTSLATPEKNPLCESNYNSAKLSQNNYTMNSSYFMKSDRKSPTKEHNKSSPISYNRTPAAFGDKMREIMKNHISDLRELIMKFSVYSQSGTSTRASSIFGLEEHPQRLNIILFGPTGSGKSSLIK